MPDDLPPPPDPVELERATDQAAEALQAAGIDVFAHIMRGTAHGIAPDGLSVALAFIRQVLGLEDSPAQD